VTESSTVDTRIDPAQGLSRDAAMEACAPGTFEVLNTEGPARAARLWTAHGPVDTPCFMPVGTYGAVKGIDPTELASLGSQVVLGNSYHLAHRPGADTVAGLGGLHEMMGWGGAILTDSGGFQVFSLRGLQKIDDDGVDYRTHFDGSKHRMTPRSVLQVQAKLGSDICMVLDHCPPGDADVAAVKDAMDRSTRWAERAASLRDGILSSGQLCFGIAQGGTNLELRQQHLEALAPLPFDGIALGGLSVGEPVPAMHATMKAVAPTMPADRPRYVMGIGTPHDLLVAVCAGIDMFDCVMPTRHARNGQLFTWQGRLNIRLAANANACEPIDAQCACTTCRRFSRGYLRHLEKQRDPLYGRLATIHNLFFMHQWVGALRNALRRGDFTRTADALMQVITQYYGPKPAPANP